MSFVEYICSTVPPPANENHPIFGRFLSDFGYKKIYAADPAKLYASTPIYKKQRTFRTERASAIARAKSLSGVTGWPGTISVVEYTEGKDKGTKSVSLQPTAAHCCYTLQHTATYCNILRYTATHCNTLQHTAAHCGTQERGHEECDLTLQHTATYCKAQVHGCEECRLALLHTAPHCATLRHTALHCNT